MLCKAAFSSYYRDQPLFGGQDEGATKTRRPTTVTKIKLKELGGGGIYGQSLSTAICNYITMFGILLSRPTTDTTAT